MMPADEEEGTGSMPPYRELRMLTRERLHLVWEMAKAGAALSGGDVAQAKAMREHPEYHNVWEFADQLEGEDVVIDGVNPILHITMHTIVENQLAEGNPSDVGKTLDRLLGQGMSRDEAIHAIAAELVGVAFPAFQGREVFNTKRYVKRLRRLGRE